MHATKTVRIVSVGYFFLRDRSDTNLLGTRVRTFRGNKEDRKKSVVTEVGEKTWQDLELSVSLPVKADNRSCRTFGSPASFVKLASFEQQWQNSRINTRDANILSYLNKLRVARIRNPWISHSAENTEGRYNNNTRFESSARNKHRFWYSHFCGL